MHRIHLLLGKWKMVPVPDQLSALVLMDRCPEIQFCLLLLLTALKFLKALLSAPSRHFPHQHIPLQSCSVPSRLPF